MLRYRYLSKVSCCTDKRLLYWYHYLCQRLSWLCVQAWVNPFNLPVSRPGIENPLCCSAKLPVMSAFPVHLYEAECHDAYFAFSIIGIEGGSCPRPSELSTTQICVFLYLPPYIYSLEGCALCFPLRALLRQWNKVGLNERKVGLGQGDKWRLLTTAAD